MIVVLAVNCGSSSVKFRLVVVDPDAADADSRTLADGTVGGLAGGQPVCRPRLRAAVDETPLRERGHEAAIAERHPRD